MARDAKMGPMVTVSGSKIKVAGGGSANEQIDVAIYSVVNNQDVTPAAYTTSGNLDANGSGTLTSAALSAGTYHVVTTAHPPGQNQVVYNDTVVIPPTPPAGP